MRRQKTLATLVLVGLCLAGMMMVRKARQAAAPARPSASTARPAPPSMPSAPVASPAEAPAAVEDATYERRHWAPVKLRTPQAADGAVELDAGPHALRFQNRDDGIRIDQVFLTPWQADEFERKAPTGNERRRRRGPRRSTATGMRN